MRTLDKIINYLEDREISAYVAGRKINFWRLLRKLIQLFL